jgi:hypothetical protein
MSDRPTPDPEVLADHNLVAASEAVTGGADDEQAQALSAEIKRRGLDV